LDHQCNPLAVYGPAMASAAYYRKEAERARQAAVNSTDPETVLRWLRIAKEYTALANAMEDEAAPPGPPPSGPMQQQPMQQQQSKIEPEDKT